jgi:hypothetical protein
MVMAARTATAVTPATPGTAQVTPVMVRTVATLLRTE